MTRLADLSLEVCFGTLALLRVHRTRFRNVSRGIADSPSDGPRPRSAQRSTRRGDCAWTTERILHRRTNSVKRSTLKQRRSSGIFDVPPSPFSPERSDIVRMTAEKSSKIALLWRGDRQARGEATAQNNRYIRVFEALAALGIEAEPAVYAEEMADEVRAQLLGCDGLLVCVDPFSDGQNRTALDALLRDVASCGVWVSAHPDVILKMGVKEVLHRTRHLGWGTDIHPYRSTGAFAEEFPSRIRSDGPRVIKRDRGNGGQGVWKVELLPDPAPDVLVRVLEARH